METETLHYDVADQYKNAYQHSTDEYLCLWEVTPEEIVGHWDWTTIAANPRWYKEEILPAFKTHNTPPLHHAQTRSAFSMSTLKNAFSKASSASPNKVKNTSCLVNGTNLDSSSSGDGAFSGGDNTGYVEPQDDSGYVETQDDSGCNEVQDLDFSGHDDYRYNDNNQDDHGCIDS